MSYTCVSETPTTVTIRVEMVLYRDQRDPEGAQCDDDAEFGIWRGSEGAWNFVDKSNPLAPRQGILNELLNPPCADAGGGSSSNIPPNEQCIYSFEVTLPKVDENYLIAYQRCCRNEAITNVVDPGGFGAVFSMEITPAGLDGCNNSPKFNDYKTAIFCTNRELIIDNNAPDIEGDSVVYSFCVPISGGGRNSMNELTCDFVKPDPARCAPAVFRNVTFTPLFSFDKPLIGDPDLTLDTKTGLLSGKPNILGEYVMAICAEEYRDGVLLTKIRRDLQVIITNCTPKDALLSVGPADEDFVLNTGVDGTLPGDPNRPFENIFIVRVCGDTEVTFDLNNASEPYKNETFLWYFDLGNEVVTSDKQAPKINFPGIGDYSGYLVIDPASPPCSDTAFVNVTILPSVEADFDLDFDDCEASEIKFEDKSIVLPDGAPNIINQWAWDFGDGNTSDVANPSYFYNTPGQKRVTLEIFDNNGCTNSEDVTIDWFPVPVPKMSPSGFLGCTPQTFKFTNLSEPLDERYMVEWDFGDGSNGPERFEISPEHTYLDAGEYDVSMKIISPNPGCEEERKFKNIITVLQGFEADFDFANGTPAYVGEMITLTNLSDPGAKSTVWDYDGIETSQLTSPTFEVRDTGKHYINLKTTWENNCSDEKRLEFEIIPCVSLRYPNAFTPNGDGKNEEFRGVLYGIRPSNFNFQIFDRWGKLIFETQNPEEGWNGKYLNTGNDLPGGVYLYQVTYDNPSCDKDISPGFATLLR